MSLTGILLDVSGSMKRNIGSGIDEKGGPWAQPIFNVIDDLIEHDLTSENRVFAIGVGAECPSKEIFDVIGTVQRITEIMQSPATEKHINNMLDILEKNGARNIRKWARDVTLIQNIVSDYMTTLILWRLEWDRDFLWMFVHDILPQGVRATASNIEPRSLFRRRSIAIIREDYYASLGLARRHSLRPVTREDIEEIVERTKPIILNSQWIPLEFCFVEHSFRIGTFPFVKDHSIFSKKDAARILSDVETHSIFYASRIIRGCVGDKELSTKRKQELLKNVEAFIYGGTPLYQSLEETIKLFEGDTSENKLLFVLSDGQPADESMTDIAKINQITSKLNEAGVKIVSCFITGSTNIHPKRLYDEISPGWECGAKFLFSLSSEVPTQHLPRAILVKRGWTIDVANNETKLFIQVNHPDNLR
jgi:hypothetical protein